MRGSGPSSVLRLRDPRRRAGTPAQPCPVSRVIGCSLPACASVSPSVKGAVAWGVSERRRRFPGCTVLCLAGVDVPFSEALSGRHGAIMADVHRRGVGCARRLPPVPCAWPQGCVRPLVAEGHVPKGSRGHTCPSTKEVVF